MSSPYIVDLVSFDPTRVDWVGTMSYLEVLDLWVGEDFGDEVSLGLLEEETESCEREGIGKHVSRCPSI